MTKRQYLEHFIEEWNASASKGKVDVEEFLDSIAEFCHQKDRNKSHIRKLDWDICARKFTEYCREVRLRFGVDLTEKTRKELEK